MSRLTSQQQAAIAARGDVLVSAGAGTGKTHTVTERCLDLILREHCPVETILMVTFTEAAAAEMRERISKALRSAAEASSDDSDRASWLAEQIMLLDVAPISTLHSFCLELVRRRFHLLALDPQFVVLDETQTEPLIQTTLDELFDRHYAETSEESAAVRELVRQHGNGSDDGLRKLVLQIHRHAHVLPSPERWYAEQRQLFASLSPEAWRELFVKSVVDWAGLWREPLAEFAAASTNVAASLAALNELPSSETKIEKVANALERVLAADQSKWEYGTKTKIRKPLESFFEDALFLHELAQTNGAALAQDWEWSRRPMLTLLQLAQEFGRDFAQAKRESGGIDFSDQEQFALRLLLDETTGVARECRERFKFVFVDECQDINAAQDAIIRAVSGEEAAANRFLVGDAKQSIYRFRLADPRIFQRYQRDWADDGKGKSTHVLPLTENFRSREALLQFINPVFRVLMRPVLGDLEYDEAAELRFGDAVSRASLSCLEDKGQPRAELCVITKDGGITESREEEAEGVRERRDFPDLQAAEREARLIARRFKDFKEQKHQIWDKDKDKGIGGFRDVDWKDMVVLLRGVAGRSEIFAKAFHQMGVPFRAARGGFLDAQEVADVLNLLRLLDNPLQDLPLLGVLRSPWVGLTAEELVELRLCEPKRKLFWEIIIDRALQHNLSVSLKAKLESFVLQYQRWRELIRHTSLTHCLETALAETHFEALLLAEDRGAERMANVRQLIDLARRFDPFQREGLFRFLQFIREQQQADVAIEPASVADGNAVRLMSIHASKGLEFPVVAVAGVGGRFNLRDLSGDILLDEDLGLCPKVLPPENRRRYPSIAHWAAKGRGRRAALGEELRLLYVAMTRACDLLLLVGTASRKDELSRWQAPTPVTDLALLKAGYFLDWLRLWFVNWAKPDEWKAADAGENALLRWKFYGTEDKVFSAVGTTGDKAIEVARPTAEELALLRGRLQWSYPHEMATLEPAKTTVTALRRRLVDEEAVLLTQVSGDRSKAGWFPRMSIVSGSKSADGRSRLSAAERGTAHHVFLQLVDVQRTQSRLDLQNEAARLERIGALQPEQVAALDFDALEKFWQSGVGEELRSLPSEYVHREMPFTARFAAAELRQLAGVNAVENVAADDFVVVQGTADLVVLLEKEIWLLDFKTDDVDADGLAAKAEFYGPQIKLYAAALSRIYGKPVKDCRLWFLTAGRDVRIEF